MRYGVATFFNHEAVPVTLVPTVKLLFYFTSDVREMTGVLVLKGLQTRDYRHLLLVRRHVRPFDQNFAVGVRSKRVQRLLVVTRDDRDRRTVPLSYAERLNASWCNVHHSFFSKRL